MLSGAGAVGIGMAPTTFKGVESKVSIGFPTDALEVIDYDEDNTTAHATRKGQIKIRKVGSTEEFFILTFGT
jgi:hypothetical protein